MINKIKCKLKQVDHILHISDIHLRNWKRHKEFSEVFKKLYKVVDQLPKNSIITVGGDIVHAKTDMSPELIDMVTRLFSELADRHPTIVITGNHDANLNNSHRLDALTPIVQGSNHPNLFYLRNSGLYEIGDIAVSVMSLLDDPETYITADKIPAEKNYKKTVALYHGTVANSKVDSGLVLSHGLDWATFAGFDLVPLGDIHKRQVLSKQNPAMFYPGSLVQQNFGEAYEGHGYALCDLTHPDKIEYTFHDIINDSGYYTLDIIDGILPSNLPITAKTGLRIRTQNTNSAQLKRVLATIRKEYKNKDATIQRLDKNADGTLVDLLDGSLNQGDVRNIQYQNQLLTEWMENNSIDDELAQKVLTINKELNGEINMPDISRNVIWKPKKFEFSNMFSYGEDNVIDFESKEGTCGIFAPNHAGKSAIFDALCFCLFDHSHRASRADQVLNRKKDSFICKLNFELNGSDYFVEKRATKYKSGPLKGRLRVDIDFWMHNAAGDVVSLNGEQRRDTDKIIQTYVGTFDDFTLTALSLQGNNSNFIDKTQSERKDLLANFLDVTIFDALCDSASKKNRKAFIILEEYQKQDFETKLGDAEKSLDDYTIMHDDTLTEHTKQKDILDDQIKKINELYEKVVPCQEEVLDPKQLSLELEEQEEALCNLRDSKKESTKNWEASKKKLIGLEYDKESALNSFDNTLYGDYQTKLKDKVVLDRELDTLKITIKNKLEKLEKLNKHEYDPQCDYCTSNLFVKDAMKTKQELVDDKTTVGEFLNKRQLIVDFIDQNGEIEAQADYIKNCATLYNSARAEKGDAESAYERIVSAIDKTQNQISTLEGSIKSYEKVLQTITENKKLEEQISIINKEKSKQSVLVQKLNKTVRDYYGKKCVAEETIEECVKTIKHMEELIQAQAAYDVYCKAMYKDGIPYTIISQAVPYIQQHANKTLSQITDFTIEMETDGKNINAFICYDDDRWALELSSGMERFLSSIAIRIALIKITNLPKPDFIAIDEGLGVLDSTNLNSMHTFFNSLKDMFRFSLVVSHIDVVRDMVDSIIIIDRIEESSYINC